MTHGATAAPPPNPRADAALAFACEICNGWGSVISQGRHELCFICQPDAGEEALDGGDAPEAEPR